MSAIRGRIYGASVLTNDELPPGWIRVAPLHGTWVWIAPLGIGIPGTNRQISACVRDELTRDEDEE